MKKLSKSAFNKASEAVREYGRPLEKSIFERYFYNGDSQNILAELKKFQNEDGGFGHGIESDFRLPHSSPMSTSVGVRHLSEIDDTKEAREMIKSAINYLEESFDSERNGWYVASREINDFPHAPWWHFDEEKQMTIIDRNWGNPSSEITAYIYKYREYVQELDVDKLVEFAINYVEEKDEFNSPIEIFCYIRLYEVLPIELQKRLENRIIVAIDQVIEYDENKWHEYLAKPMEFVTDPDKNRFGVDGIRIDKSMDFMIGQIEEHGRINPPWGKSFYIDDLKPVYNEWIGVLNLETLKILRAYGRLEE